MFKNTFQSGFLSILYSIGTEPLQLWSTHTPSDSEDAHVELVTDDLIRSSAIELMSSNLADTFITCPGTLNRSLGIKLPVVVLVAKNLEKFFSFEIQVVDDTNTKRRLRASNYQVTTRVKPYLITMPMRLEAGWNHIVIDLADYVKRAYATNYVETCRITVHASCRLRRIYFADRIYKEEELPAEFKIFLPVRSHGPATTTLTSSMKVAKAS